MPLPRPAASQPRYGELLGDADHWRPYVLEVLDREGLPLAEMEAPYIGTFPTFLAGDVVVKLFGAGYDGAAGHATELAMAELLAAHPEIRTPALLASGTLYEAGDDWPWPYLVYARIGGTALRDADASPAVRREAAAELGTLVAALHRLPLPPVIRDDDLLTRLRSDAPDRLRNFGLPGHLADQALDFLADAPTAQELVHADLTVDHLFLDDRGLVGIIDWGDAMAAHPWYELVAVRFGGFDGHSDLLAAFTEAYGAPLDRDHPRRALQGILEFRFNAITGLSERLDLARIRSLDELAFAVHDLS